MAKFKVTIPVVVNFTYEVEAHDADAAIDSPVNLGALFYKDSHGGISRKRGASIGDVMADNAHWDRAEAEPAE